MQVVNIFSALVALVASPPVRGVLSLLAADLAAHVDRLAVVEEPRQLVALAVAPFNAALCVVGRLELEAVRACCAACANALGQLSVGGTVRGLCSSVYAQTCTGASRLRAYLWGS